MNNRSRASALEYGVTLTGLSVPVLVLGLKFSSFIDVVFAGLMGQISIVTMTLGG